MKKKTADLSTFHGFLSALAEREKKAQQTLQVTTLKYRVSDLDNLVYERFK